VTVAAAVVWKALAEPWRACVEELWEGYRAGSPPHGAVVVGPAGRVLARARNRQLEAPARGPYVAGHRLAHAELSALPALDDRAVDPGACTLYTANEPCPMCTGALAMSGIWELRHTAHGAVRWRDAYAVRAENRDPGDGGQLVPLPGREGPLRAGPDARHGALRLPSVDAGTELERWRGTSLDYKSGRC
jgi:tRNA(Arg) A34 adenosine deaminase TadA